MPKKDSPFSYAKKGLFLAVWTVEALGEKLMWLYSSSGEKSNPWKSRSEFQMFSLISGGHVCAPPRDTNISFPY